MSMIYTLSYGIWRDKTVLLIPISIIYYYHYLVDVYQMAFTLKAKEDVRLKAKSSREEMGCLRLQSLLLSVRMNNVSVFPSWWLLTVITLDIERRCPFRSRQHTNPWGGVAFLTMSLFNVCKNLIMSASYQLFAAVYCDDLSEICETVEGHLVTFGSREQVKQTQGWFSYNFPI